MRYLIAALLVLALTSCTVHSVPLFQQPDKRVLSLEKELAKLKTQTDPVERAKTKIRISEILLSLVSDSVRSGDTEVMDQRLDEYVATIQKAHETLMKTGRDAHK